MAVDLTRSLDPDGFRAKVTQDQRIHVHLDLGRVFEQKGNLEAALMEYQQALAACERKGFGRTRSADEALAHRRIANALDRMGRFAQAEVHYRKALHLSPRDPKIWNDAGYSYYLQGRWADAERTLKTAARYAPEDARITTNLGLTLAAAGRTKEAIALLSRYSGDAIGHANLGFLLAATGQVELARQQYLQALALRPNLAVAQRAWPSSIAPSDAEHVADDADSPRAATRRRRWHGRIVPGKRCRSGEGRRQPAAGFHSRGITSSIRRCPPSKRPEPVARQAPRTTMVSLRIHLAHDMLGVLYNGHSIASRPRLCGSHLSLEGK